MKKMNKNKKKAIRINFPPPQKKNSKSREIRVENNEKANKKSIFGNHRAYAPNFTGSTGGRPSQSKFRVKKKKTKKRFNIFLLVTVFTTTKTIPKYYLKTIKTIFFFLLLTYFHST